MIALVVFNLPWTSHFDQIDELDNFLAMEDDENNIDMNDIMVEDNEKES